MITSAPALPTRSTCPAAWATLSAASGRQQAYSIARAAAFQAALNSLGARTFRARTVEGCSASTGATRPIDKPVASEIPRQAAGRLRRLLARA